MIEGLLALVPVVSGAFWTLFWVFLRVGAMMAVLPAFGEQSVPMRVRFAIALAFSLVVAPAVASTIPGVTDPPGLLPLVTELVVGLIFGLFLRLFVMVLQIAGTIAAQSTSLSQIFGSSGGIDPLPAMGHLLVLGGLALATVLGLHVHAASYMILTYDIVPAGTLPSPTRLAEIGVDEVGRAFALAFVLAAPFVVASLLYNVTLGVINRAMPQLMVAFVGAPAITAGGLALLALAAPFLLQLWGQAFFGFMSEPFGSPP